MSGVNYSLPLSLCLFDGEKLSEQLLQKNGINNTLPAGIIQGLANQ
jgi:hypothetical protein